MALWEWRVWRKRRDWCKWRIWATFAKVLATSQMRWQMIYIGYKEWINSPQNGYYNLWDTNTWYCHNQWRFQNDTYIHYIFGDSSPFSSKSPLSKGPFAILFEFLLRRWQMFAIFAIFAKYAIFAKIATLKGTLCYWNFHQPAGNFFFATFAIFVIACISGHFFPRTALLRRRHHGISLKRMWVQTEPLLYDYNFQGNLKIRNSKS